MGCSGEGDGREISNKGPAGDRRKGGQAQDVDVDKRAQYVSGEKEAARMAMPSLPLP